MGDISKNVIVNYCLIGINLLKFLLTISNWVLIACDEIPKRHFNATFYATF